MNHGCVIRIQTQMEIRNIYYQNVRGLRTKQKDFMSELIVTDYSVICLTETWLDVDIPSANYFTPNYDVFRKDRCYTATGQIYGGGVLIATYSSYGARRRNDLESSKECVWIEIATKDCCNLLLGNYYFPPAFDETVFEDHFRDIGMQ